MSNIPMLRAVVGVAALAVLANGCASTDPTQNEIAPALDAPTVLAEPTTVGEVFAAIAELGLEPSEVDAYLFERARAEGEITLYLNPGSRAEEIAEAWSEAFARAYPGLGMRHVTLSASDFNPRVLSEHRASRPQADVVRTSATLLDELSREGILALHSGILRPEGSPDWAVTPNAIFARITSSVIAWATERVGSAGPPQQWDDFLQPEFSGCTLISSPSWIVGMIADRGLDKTEAWFEAFLANGGRMTLDGGATVLRKIVSGEADCLVHMNGSQAEDQRAQGAPIDWFAPEGSPTVVTAFSVLTTTPRPHAVALFVRWALGSDGAAIAADFGELSVRADVAPESERFRPWQDPTSEEFQRFLIVGPEVVEEFGSLAEELLARYHTPNVLQR